jgi:cytochrome c oxidase subunit 3
VYDAETKKVEYKDIATTIKGNYWGPYVDKDGNRIENQMEAHKKVLAARQASGGGHAHGAETVQTPDVGVYRTKGPAVFGQFFFGITGFHGFHVSTGVLINILILIQILRGVYQRNGDYEMVEKVGLYWHFVDLVWVFVFTFFYLV